MLAEALRGRGLTEEAIYQVEEAVRRHPQDADARVTLAEVLVDAGRRTEALRHLRRVEGLDRPPLAGLELLTWILATSADPGLRSPPQALRVAQRCAARAGGAWTTKRVLAAALAANGRHPEAAKVALEAAAAAPAERRDELMELQARFRAGEDLEE